MRNPYPGRSGKALSGLSLRSQRAHLFWQQRSVSEQRALRVVLAVVTLAVLWWVALGPALATLRAAEAQHKTLDAQLQTMQDLAAQAASLKALPVVRADESRRALEAAVRQQLGAAAQLSLQGDRAVVTLKGVPGGTLAAWLAQVRTNARALPQEAHLRVSPTQGGWDGSLVLRLPPA